MANCPQLRPQGRKRQHAEADFSQGDPPSRPSKKLKSTKEHQSASRFPPPEFWDSLSKVWLTPRALRELDRRNQLKGKACPRTPTRAQALARQLSVRNELQRFARHGGPELSNLRGYPEPADIKMSSRRSNRSGHSSHSSQSRQSKSTKQLSNSTSKTSNTESRRRSSAYDADFEQHLADNGIYPNNRKSKLNNLNEIRKCLAQPRPSLSPSRFSDTAFEAFQRKNEDVIDEGEVMREVLPILCGDTDIPSKQNLLFTRLESITNKTTVDAKPDFYDGAYLQSIDRQVQEDLGPYIIPTAHRTAPVAPNFFIEAKAPRGGVDVAKRQACYDAALGARAMHELQSYSAGKPVYDKNAYTLSATFHAGNLNMYSTHVTPSGLGGSPEYHMTQIRSLSLIDTKERYLEGATHLRNGRDAAMKYRDQFISAANERARSMKADQSTLESSNYNSVSDTIDAYPAKESQTSQEEFAANSFLTHVEEPEPSEDELAATSFSYPAATSFSCPAKKSNYYDLADIVEESETSADELTISTYVKPISSKKRPSKGSKKTVAKAPRYSTSASRQKHRSKK